jgi:hypothetical protein
VRRSVAVRRTGWRGYGWHKFASFGHPVPAVNCSHRSLLGQDERIEGEDGDHWPAS